MTTGWLVLILIPALGVSALLLRIGLLREPGGPLELGWFSFGVCLFASISFIAFHCRVWSGDCRAIFKKRSPSFNAGPSSFDGLCSSARAFLRLAGVLVMVIVVALEYTGHHAELIQFLSYMGGKLSKLIAFLMQP